MKFHFHSGKNLDGVFAEILRSERCKGMQIYLEKFCKMSLWSLSQLSIQPKTILSKFEVISFIISILSLLPGTRPIIPFLCPRYFCETLEGSFFGCMDSYDSDQRLILQGFSISTRLAFLCTAQISKFQFKIHPFFFAIFSNFFEIFTDVQRILPFFNSILMKFDRNFTNMVRNDGICRIFRVGGSAGKNPEKNLD